jgi:two-component sensor histidine kinase
MELDDKSKKSTNFGTQLIKILCKKLNGEIKIAEKEDGYSTEISFAKWK